MNKYPWFTHDHNAHEDEFIQTAMDEFGHFGYAAYFITLELIHKHGSNGVLTMKASRYASHIRSRMDRIPIWGSFLERFGKASLVVSGNDLTIKMEKFIERQGKMKGKTLSSLPQTSAETPIEKKEKEIEKESKEQKTEKPDIVVGKKNGWGKIYSATFEAFWKFYINKTGKDEAYKEWTKAGLAPHYAEVIEALKRYNLTPAVRKGMIKNPARWIRDGNYKDETPGLQAAVDVEAAKARTKRWNEITGG